MTNEEGEIRELTDEDLVQFAPFSALPADLRQLLQPEKQVVPDKKPSATSKPAA